MQFYRTFSEPIDEDRVFTEQATLRLAAEDAAAGREWEDDGMGRPIFEVHYVTHPAPAPVASQQEEDIGEVTGYIRMYNSDGTFSHYKETAEEFRRSNIPQYDMDGNFSHYNPN
jgi:hypothetical protein